MRGGFAHVGVGPWIATSREDGDPGVWSVASEKRSAVCGGGGYHGSEKKRSLRSGNSSGRTSWIGMLSGADGAFGRVQVVLWKRRRRRRTTKTSSWNAVLWPMPTTTIHGSAVSCVRLGAGYPQGR